MEQELDVRKLYNKKYYEKNKEKLQEKYKCKVSCPLCDKKVAKSSLGIHLKSKICEKGQYLKLKKMTFEKIEVDLDDYFTNVNK